ncbi:hypothetical protein JI741_08545 [Chryseolinea sp. Jin1]|uniref:DUF3787 domain-containing protein n=2 Tax=Chryseolinea lacunae TaxID=2801331 RepID=A0ABS1KPW6_9BACT|nr:hypothetical protein [Chryseolinea lacunae]
MKMTASKKSKTETLKRSTISKAEMNRALNSPHFMEKDEKAVEILKNSNWDEFVKGLK